MKIVLHILQIIIYSLIATVLIFPVSVLDTYFVATFNSYNFYLTIILMSLADGFTAIITYKFAYWLAPKIIKKEKTQEKVKNIVEKLGKWGGFILFIASATPFPYTLTLYACGLTNWGNNKKIFIISTFGRMIKYILIAILTYYGIQLLGYTK